MKLCMLVTFFFIHLSLNFAVASEILCTTFIGENEIGCYYNQRCVVFKVVEFRSGQDAMWKCKYVRQTGGKIIVGELINDFWPWPK